MNRCTIASLCVGILLLLASHSRSNEVISAPLNDWTSNWGPGNGLAFGQSFVAPPGATQLLEFTFDYLTGTSNDNAFDFIATIYAFNPDTLWIIGSVLWISDVQSISAVQAPFFSPTPYTFTPEIEVTAGQTYIMIITSAGVPNPPPQDAAMGRMGIDTTESYAGGKFLYRATSGELSNLTNGPWEFPSPSYDTAFSATFAVPEPSAIGLGALGMMLGAGIMRMRNRKSSLSGPLH